MKVVVGSQKIDLQDGGKVVGLSLHKSAAGEAKTVISLTAPEPHTTHVPITAPASHALALLFGIERRIWGTFQRVRTMKTTERAC